MNIGNIIFEVCNLMLSPFTKRFFASAESNDEINKTVNLYPNPKFTRIRFWDAPFVRVEKLIPKSGTILDLGCGEGIFSNFLGISSDRRKVLGIEINKERFELSQHGISNVKFVLGDIEKVDLPEADAIVLFHVLHHLSSYSSQIHVISRCFNQLSRGGKLIIVEVEPKISLKYFLSTFTDHFLVPWIFEKRVYSPIFFRRRVAWGKILKNKGFNCRVINAEKGHPFTHIIIECSKQ